MKESSAARTRWILLVTLVVTLVGAGVSAATAQGQGSRLSIVTSKATIIDLKAPASKVAVANPGIADVQVITPAQLLVIGRGPGVTSLAVFSGKSVQMYDLVVYPSPVAAVAVGPLSGSPHSVLVQKADKVTEHYFLRGVDQTWVELAGSQAEAEAPKR